MQKRGLEKKKPQAELKRNDRQAKKKTQGEVTVIPNVRAMNDNDLYKTAAHNDAYVLKIFY